MIGVSFERHAGEQAITLLDRIADLYAEIHSEIPSDSDPIFSRSSFITRTSKQAQAAGFELISATKEDGLIGFSFGYPFPPGRWWAESTAPAREILAASKFAVIELDVQKSHRRQGLGKTLLDSLLADRPEGYATLAAIPDSLAHAMYIRWGWTIAGCIGGEGPGMDAMTVPLAHDK
jgi:GNAT superfamily N-acetyltransferase